MKNPKTGQVIVRIPRSGQVIVRISRSGQVIVRIPNSGQVIVQREWIAVTRDGIFRVLFRRGANEMEKIYS